jgi:hypothetical protein
MLIRGNGVTLRTQKVIQGGDNGHVGRPCEVSPAPPCDDTEFVTLGDRTVVSWSSRYKGIFTGNKLSFALPFMFRVSFHNASPRERTVPVPFQHRW